jgi:hypothetical protein
LDRTSPISTIVHRNISIHSDICKWSESGIIQEPPDAWQGQRMPSASHFNHISGESTVLGHVAAAVLQLHGPSLEILRLPTHEHALARQRGL